MLPDFAPRRRTAAASPGRSSQSGTGSGSSRSASPSAKARQIAHGVQSGLIQRAQARRADPPDALERAIHAHTSLRSIATSIRRPVIGAVTRTAVNAARPLGFLELQRVPPGCDSTRCRSRSAYNLKLKLTKTSTRWARRAFSTFHQPATRRATQRIPINRRAHRAARDLCRAPARICRHQKPCPQFRASAQRSACCKTSAWSGQKRTQSALAAFLLVGGSTTLTNAADPARAESAACVIRSAELFPPLRIVVRRADRRSARHHPVGITPPPARRPIRAPLSSDTSLP